MVRARVTQSVSADPVLDRVAIGGGAGRGPAVEIPQTIDSLAVGGGLLHTWADDERSIRTTDLASGLQAATATSSRSDNPYQDSLAATTDGTLTVLLNRSIAWRPAAPKRSSLRRTSTAARSRPTG